MKNYEALIPVPAQLNNPFFFPEENAIWKHDYSKRLNPALPFIYELAHYAWINSIKPWEHPEDSVPVILNEWRNVKDNLAVLYINKDRKGAMLPMKKGIGLFLEAVFWSNHLPVQLDQIDLEHLKVKPVNVNERLQFIISRPSLYHSFIQLGELLDEQEKHFVKQMALKKIR